MRVGSGRAVGYDLTRGEFLVGGADGCDVRLPGSHLPAVIAQFGRTADGVFVRRLAPAFPILLNGKPLAGSDPVAVNSADRVAIGSADIVVTVNGRGHIRPTFHAVSSARSISPPPVARNTPRYRATFFSSSSAVMSVPRRISSVSGLWQYRQRNGQPARNTVSRVPGPSTAVTSSHECSEPSSPVRTCASRSGRSRSTSARPWVP